MGPIYFASLILNSHDLKKVFGCSGIAKDGIKSGQLVKIPSLAPCDHFKERIDIMIKFYSMPKVVT